MNKYFKSDGKHYRCSVCGKPCDKIDYEVSREIGVCCRKLGEEVFYQNCEDWEQKQPITQLINKLQDRFNIKCIELEQDEYDNGLYTQYNDNYAITFETKKIIKRERYQLNYFIIYVEYDKKEIWIEDYLEEEKGLFRKIKKYIGKELEK